MAEIISSSAKRSKNRAVICQSDHAAITMSLSWAQAVRMRIGCTRPTTCANSSFTSLDVFVDTLLSLNGSDDDGSSSSFPSQSRRDHLANRFARLKI